ncbi:MAG: 30S ribosome-binding factor RbfA [Pseudomonadota bacterium]|nr:30S ribosome-binding factor RbfA [Pseudomonadota bacterium]
MHLGKFQFSNRQLRVGELLKRTLATIIARGDIYINLSQDVPITVSEVRCSGDLKRAIIYVLPLGGKNAEEVVKAMNGNKGEIRKLLAKQVELKFIPELKFAEDKSFDQMEHTRQLLNDPKVKRDTNFNQVDENNSI